MSLISGLLQGFAQGAQIKQQQDFIKEYKDTHKKLLEAQIDAALSQTQAREKFAELAGGKPAAFNKAPGLAIQAGLPLGGMAAYKDADTQQSLASAWMAALGGQTQPAPAQGAATGQGAALPENPQQAFKGAPGSPIIEPAFSGGKLSLEQRAPKTVVKEVPQGDGTVSLQLLDLDRGGAVITDFGRVPKNSIQTLETEDGPMVTLVDADTGEKKEVIGPAKAPNMSTEQGGRLAGLEQGLQLVQTLQQGLLNPDGTVNRKNLANMTTDIPLLGEGIPFTTGRNLRSNFRTSIDGIVRARTGAAMTIEELDATMSELMPSKFDDDDTVRNKLAKVKDFLAGAIDVITLPPRIRKAWEARHGSQSTGGQSALPEGIPEGSRQIGTSGGKPVYQAPNGKQYILDY
jgi:hypothetical protein